MVNLVLMYEELDKRQKKFCREFAKAPGNAAAAARRAGYSAKSARQQASELLANPNISEEVERIQEELAAKEEEALEKVIEMLKAVALQNPKDILDPEYENEIIDLSKISTTAAMAIEGVEVKHGKFGKSVKVTKSSRLQAAEMLLRMAGKFEKDNKQKAQPMSWNIKFGSDGKESTSAGS